MHFSLYICYIFPFMKCASWFMCSVSRWVWTISCDISNTNTFLLLFFHFLCWNKLMKNEAPVAAASIKESREKYETEGDNNTDNKNELWFTRRLKKKRRAIQMTINKVVSKKQHLTHKHQTCISMKIMIHSNQILACLTWHTVKD